MSLRPLLLTIVMIFMMAAAVMADPVSRDKKKPEEFVVVIDAGHGGRDFGAVGAVTNEKTINLKVALWVKEFLSDDAPDIRIVMTRSDDRFLPLAERASIANKAGGDLFVSIHTNSVDKKNPNRKTVAGASVYSLGLGRTEENLAVAMRENAVMTLEADYTTTYEGFDPKSAESYIIFEMDRDLHMEQSISAAKAVQNQLIRTASRIDRGVRQAGFLVLRATSMPAILVELDFICNPSQEEYMASEKGQKKLGRALAEGIISFSDEVARARARIDGDQPVVHRKKTGSKSADTPGDAASKPVKTGPQPYGSELSDAADSVFYRIQFMTLSRPLKADDKRILDLPAPVHYYRHGGSVKYVCGRFVTEKEALEALNEVKRRYSDAFVIRTRGGSRL